jgi:hypothetical protein
MGPNVPVSPGDRPVAANAAVDFALPVGFGLIVVQNCTVGLNWVAPYVFESADELGSA